MHQTLYINGSSVAKQCYKMYCNVLTKIKKSWITKGLLISIKRKQKMHKTLYINGSSVAKQCYKMYCNELTKIKKSCKQCITIISSRNTLIIQKKKKKPGMYCVPFCPINPVSIIQLLLQLITLRLQILEPLPKNSIITSLISVNI